MKKKILTALTATMIAGSVSAMAAPAEIQEGGWNITLGSSITPSTEVGGHDTDGDSGFYGNVTYGLTDEWALQYDYSHYGYGDDWGVDAKGDASEINVLYKLTPNLNAYAGYVYYGENYDGWGHSTEGYQAGLQGWYPFSDKIKGFAKVGIGNKSQIYEIGCGYAVADNWDIDLSYRYAEYEDVGGADMTFDGVRAGISTSF